MPWAASSRRSSGSPTRTASRRTRGRAAPTAPASPTASSSTSTRPTRTRRPTSPTIRAGALLLGERLRELGLTPFAMTSGSRGLHVVAPLRRRHHADVVRARAGEIADELVRDAPDAGLTTFWRKEKREGRVLLDTARNTYGQTTVAPYAVRAIPGAPVAAPLAWEELEDPELHPRRCTRCATVPGGSRSAAIPGRASPRPRPSSARLRRPAPGVRAPGCRLGSPRGPRPRGARRRRRRSPRRTASPAPRAQLARARRPRAAPGGRAGRRSSPRRRRRRRGCAPRRGSRPPASPRG